VVIVIIMSGVYVVDTTDHGLVTSGHHHHEWGAVDILMSALSVYHVVTADSDHGQLTDRLRHPLTSLATLHHKTPASS